MTTIKEAVIPHHDGTSVARELSQPWSYLSELADLRTQLSSCGKGCNRFSLFDARPWFIRVFRLRLICRVWWNILTLTQTLKCLKSDWWMFPGANSLQLRSWLRRRRNSDAQSARATHSPRYSSQARFGIPSPIWKGLYWHLGSHIASRATRR